MFRLICCFWLAVSLPGMLYANECVLSVSVCVAKVITENIIILITHKKS